jgi:transposase
MNSSKFLLLNLNSKPSREIFEECGFDIDIIGMDRVCSARDRWRAAYRKNGVDGLHDNRAGKSGRPRERELTPEEKYARLDAENNVLKAEIELLKKIRFAERGLKEKN